MSLLIAGLMIHSGYGLVKASGQIFLEAAPQRIDPTAIGQTLAAQPGVVEIHDLHVWEVTSGFPALSAHVTVNADCDCHATRRAMDTLIHDRFDIEDTTLQVDHEHEDLLNIEALRAHASPAH